MNVKILLECDNYVVEVYHTKDATADALLEGFKRAARLSALKEGEVQKDTMEALRVESLYSLLRALQECLEYNR